MARRASCSTLPRLASSDDVGSEGLDATTDGEYRLDPKEIFELIVKADEKLKYAHEDNAGLRRQQARELLEQAREAAVSIGNDALVAQADTRLADLGEEPA